MADDRYADAMRHAERVLGTVAARAVVVATGARYRRLSVPDYDRFEGHGIHYAATAIEAGPCRGEEVVIVG